MEEAMLEKVKCRFQQHGFQFPDALQFMFSHNLLGEDLESPLEPWCSAWVENLGPIKELYPKSPVRRDIFPFARRQDMDQLACIENNTGKVVEVHYDPMNPTFMEITDEFDDAWEWLISAIHDIRLFWEK